MYCTISQVKNKNELILKKIDDSTIEDAIFAAMEEVDGRIGDKYPVPLTSVPHIIRKITVDLAAGELINDKVANTGKDEEPMQGINLIEHAEELLDKIANGEINLKVGSTPVKSKPGIISTTYGNKPRFSNWNPGDISTYRG